MPGKKQCHSKSRVTRLVDGWPPLRLSLCPQPPTAHLIFLELTGCMLLAPQASLFWDSNCEECVVQVLWGLRTWDSCGPHFSLTARLQRHLLRSHQSKYRHLFEGKSGHGVSLGNSKAMFYSVFIALRKIEIVTKYLISRIYSKKRLQSMSWG